VAKAWSTWLPDVLPHVAGCPVLVAEHEIKRSAQLFFERSRAWSVLTAAHAVVAAQPTVTVSIADTGLELVRPEAAWYDGKGIGVATQRTMDEQPEDWSAKTGTPTALVLLTPGVVRLYPIPTANAATGLKLRVSVRPSDTATGIPDDLAVKYREDIKLGALGRLLLQAKKPWSDGALGQGYLEAFEKRADAANVAANVMGHSTARRAATVHWC
jgi:hypothetical protein